MAGKQWTPKEVTTLIKLWSEGKTAHDVAVELSRTLPSTECKIKYLLAAKQINRHLPVKPDTEKDYTEFIEFDGDFISISDVHAPFWNEKLFDKVFMIAKKFNIQNLIIAGDFFNMDSFDKSHASEFGGADKTEKEFLTAEYILYKCLEVFKTIYIIMGNHEKRLFKILMGNVRPRRWFKMISGDFGQRIKVSDYCYCRVNNKWIVGHPNSFSQVGGTIPQKLADKFQMNVICGHNHMMGLQMSSSGRLGIDQGMACDEKKIEYHQKYLTGYRKWQAGFTMVRNDCPYLFSMAFTDWKFWERQAIQ